MRPLAYASDAAQEEAKGYVDMEQLVGKLMDVLLSEAASDAPGDAVPVLSRCMSQKGACGSVSVLFCSR
jgi:hypothetical protein